MLEYKILRRAYFDVKSTTFNYPFIFIEKVIAIAIIKEGKIVEPLEKPTNWLFFLSTSNLYESSRADNTCQPLNFSSSIFFRGEGNWGWEISINDVCVYVMRCSIWYYIWCVLLYWWCFMNVNPIACTQRLQQRQKCRIVRQLNRVGRSNTHMLRNCHCGEYVNFILAKVKVR